MANNTEASKSRLYKDDELLSLESGISVRVDEFVAKLSEVRKLHPDVRVLSRTFPSSFFVGANEESVDVAMQESDYDLTLELLAEAADHRRRPGIEVDIAGVSRNKRSLRSAFKTIELLALKYGGNPVTNRDPIEATFIPDDNEHEYHSMRTYWFTPET